MAKARGLALEDLLKKVIGEFRSSEDWYLPHCSHVHMIMMYILKLAMGDDELYVLNARYNLPERRHNLSGKRAPRYFRTVVRIAENFKISKHEVLLREKRGIELLRNNQKARDLLILHFGTIKELCQLFKRRENEHAELVKECKQLLSPSAMLFMKLDSC